MGVFGSCSVNPAIMIYHLYMVLPVPQLLYSLKGKIIVTIKFFIDCSF